MESLREDDPRRIGGYELLGRLGTGGMGEVFLGRSPGGRLVAVKTIHRSLTADPRFRIRFAREVAALRRVGGFHTAPVVDAAPGDDPAWLATAYVPGPSLREAVAVHGPLPEPAVTALGAGLAEGLNAVHSCGLVHRDLKPGNVVLASDGPRIIDFGIAHITDASSLTVTGAVLGTPSYMSPEQARSEGSVGPASDVFSLGCVLYFAACGRGPFDAATPAVCVHRLLNEEPSLDAVPEPLRDLIASCLDKDPAARPSPPSLLHRLASPGEPTGGWLPPAVTTMIDELAASVLALRPSDPPQSTADPASSTPTDGSDVAEGAPPGWAVPTDPSRSSPGARAVRSVAAGNGAVGWGSSRLLTALLPASVVLPLAALGAAALWWPTGEAGQETRVGAVVTDSPTAGVPAPQAATGTPASRPGSAEPAKEPSRPSADGPSPGNVPPPKEPAPAPEESAASRDERPGGNGSALPEPWRCRSGYVQVPRSRIWIRPCVRSARTGVSYTVHAKAAERTGTDGPVSLWVWVSDRDVVKYRDSLNKCRISLSSDEETSRCGPFTFTPPKPGDYHAAADSSPVDDELPPTWSPQWSGTGSVSDVRWPP